MDDQGMLCGWTIYRRPLDFPNHYAVRQWWVVDAGLVSRNIVVLCESLDEAREQIPAGAIQFLREDTDDPAICETWM